MTPGARRGVALLAALVLHAAGFALAGAVVPGRSAGALFWVDMQGGASAAADLDDEGLFVDEEANRETKLVEPVALVLVEELPPELAAPPVPVDATGEEARLDRTHPAPSAAVDMAGARAAARGGVADAGSRASSGRDDREDKRAQLWTDARRYQLPRTRTGRDRRSDESIARAPEQAFDDRARERRRKAGDGQRELSPPLADGNDETPAAIDDTGSAADDALPASDPRASRTVGVLVAVDASPLVALGPPATESPRDGRLVDNASAIASSDETDPAPFDLTRPAAGGSARRPGVTGRGETRSGRGARRRGRGNAAVRAPVDRGAPELAVQAWRTDPYFRTMYARLDSLVRYPRALARSLEQGEVVVRFTLYADGRVTRVRIEKSSGYEEFDEQVTNAIARAAPFGPVPADVLGERRAITVRAPYAFRNPWIR